MKLLINEDSLELPQKHSALFTETMRHEEIIDVHKYNDLLKLFRITAYVLRFVNNMKRKQGKKKLIINKYLSTEELVDTKRYWIKKNQEVLKNQKNFVDVEKVLNVKEDENGLLRSYSRLKNANINQDTKFPIMICKDQHKLSEMLVNYYHV